MLCVGYAASIKCKQSQPSAGVSWELRSICVITTFPAYTLGLRRNFELFRIFLAKNEELTEKRFILRPVGYPQLIEAQTFAKVDSPPFHVRAAIDMLGSLWLVPSRMEPDHSTRTERRSSDPAPIATTS